MFFDETFPFIGGSLKTILDLSWSSYHLMSVRPALRIYEIYMLSSETQSGQGPLAVSSRRVLSSPNKREGLNPLPRTRPTQG